MKIHKIDLKNLDSRIQGFLESLNAFEEEKTDDPGIPIYWKDGEVVFWISDFKLKSDANLAFEKAAAGYGLYRGGAVVILKTRLKYKVCGSIVKRDVLILIPDERYLLGKPIAGIAQFDEGDDLIKNAYRELAEELLIFTLDKEGESLKRIVPKGMALTHGNVLDIEISEFVEIGELSFQEYYFNEKNRALEIVTLWDIDYNREGGFSCVHNEDWLNGGYSGFVVYAIDIRTHDRVGVFSGWQGFVPLSEYALHSSVMRYLSK